MKRKLLNALGLLLGVGAGAGFLVLLAATRPKPKRKPVPDPRPLVETVTLEPRAYDAVVEGFGTVEPSQTLPVVSEVGGEVVELGGNLGEGAMVEKGALLFRVDDASILTDIERLDAQIAASEAQTQELRAQHAADETFLGIEQEVLALARKDYERKLELAKDSQISTSELEAAEMRRKERELAVEKRKAALAAFEKRLAVLQASKRALEASRKAQKIRLAKTVARAPYRCRVLDLDVDLGKVLQPGAVAMVLFPVGEPVEISVPVESRLLPALFDFERLERGTPPWTQVTLEAEVHWEHFGRPQKTTGTVSRFLARVDPATRTLTARIEVPGPEEQAKQGGARGLLSGTFVKVRIRGRRFENVFVLPERALEPPDAVFVVRDGKLHRARVDPLVVLGEDVVLASDGSLPAGAGVVVTALEEAFDGAQVRVAGEEATRP